MALALGIVACTSGCSDEIDPPPGYPPGPYGSELGQVFRYVPMDGFVVDPPLDGLASQRPYVPFDMLAVSASAEPYALLHLAAMW